jgi:hypothetical protein
VTRTVRTATVLGGSAIFVAWFVTLGVRASVGAIDPVAPRYAAMGGIPASPPPLKPLVLPRRDPFAADEVRINLAGVNGRGGIAGTQVPDPSAFGKTSGAALGVIGVIVGDQDAYALVEDGAQIQVVHVNDAFAGSTVTSITEHGVVLANGVTLDVDASRPGTAQGGTAAFGAPADGASPQPSAAASGQSQSNAGVSALQQTTPQNVGGSVQYQPPRTTTTTLPGSVLPGPLTGTQPGSLFPLLTPPQQQNGTQHQ